MSKDTAPTEVEMADHYDATGDVSEFDDGQIVRFPRHRRDVVLSVRFSPSELDELRARAEQRGMKLTALVRAAALNEVTPVDSEQFREAVTRLLADGAKLRQVLGLPAGVDPT